MYSEHQSTNNHKPTGILFEQAQERNSGMAVESQIGKQIREVLATSLRRDPLSIKPEHSLRDDLGLDSLMTFELLYDLEKAFDMEIPNDDLPGLQTLDDVVKYVEGRVNPSAKTSAQKPKAIPPTAAKPTKTTTTTKAGQSSKGTKTKPKAKATTPAKTKKATATTKSRSASSANKSRSKSPATKRATAAVATKKGPTTAKSKAKKK